MRGLGLGLALVLGCQKHDAEPVPVPVHRDAAVIEVDWARCEAAELAAETAPFEQATRMLIEGCQVCGDWKPLIQWNTPHDQGGPTRQQIEYRMDACQAFCDSTAKQRFMGTLDDARGTTSRGPWRYLGEECKGKVSALPDSRYMSAPYFALDRIARALSAHWGHDLTAAVHLPAVSITGAGLEYPTPTSEPRDTSGLVQVTVLGDGPHVGRLPIASLGAGGVTVDYRGEPYPGATVAPGALEKAIRALDPSPHPIVVLFAPREMPAAQIQQAIAKTANIEFHRAVEAPGSLPGWPLPAMEQEPIRKK